jgi:hypothetical protein
METTHQPKEESRSIREHQGKERLPLGNRWPPGSRRGRWQSLSRCGSWFCCRLGKRHVSRQEQKGRFVAIGWNAQLYQYVAQPKARSVDDGETWPDWQREPDATLCEAVEQTVMAEVIAA